MCGIAGYIADVSPAKLSSTVAAMNRSLARRGPDSEGLEVWTGAALGQRRLAILDLSDAGKQPMLSDDEQVGVVFNGCIYNFQDLRKQLESLGCRFRSNCDTEVLVHGYQQWGVDVLVSRLRGMFAIGIWDNRRRALLLIRDRLGVKPLVYIMRGDSIAFASTVSALREADLCDRLNPDAVLEYLEFGWIGEDQAIYTGVRKVAPASIVEWRNGQISHRTYWTPPEPASGKLSLDEAADQAEELLIEAAKLRLISDVPAGSLLSGGIDSALVCWAMARVGANLSSFTVGTPGDPADESHAAAETAKLIGIPHDIISVDRDEKPDLDELTAAFGEPFACSSALGMLRVCKAVRNRVTVLLTGDGGDDVFLGYEHHRKFLYSQRLSQFLPSGLGSFWQSLEPVTADIGLLRRPWRMVDFALGGLGAVTNAHNGLPWFYNSGSLGDQLQGRFLSHRMIARTAGGGRQLMRDFLDYERRTRFVSEYMTKVDGASMYWAVEARSPFLDHKLWEFAASLPWDVRLQGGELKAVLRTITRRRIGEVVASRRKQGFTIPVERWLASTWLPEIEELQSKPLVETEGWLKPGTLKSAVASVRSSGTAPVQLWSVLVFERWLRRQPAARPAAAEQFITQ